MFHRHSLTAVCLLAVSLGAASSAEAQTIINSVPYTISAAGKYVLGSKFVTASASQVAITISANNVILDLNGFFVSGPGNTFASTTPVISVGNVSNVTIRNGTVANNGIGILFTGSLPNSINHLVENVNVTRCYVAGVRFSNATSGTVIRSNSFSQTGGNTSTSFSTVAAIYSNGGLRVEDNTITTVSSSNATVISGIDAGGGDFVIGNTISSVSGNGIRFGTCQNNLASQCTTAFASIANAGGNF